MTTQHYEQIPMDCARGSNKLASADRPKCQIGEQALVVAFYPNCHQQTTNELNLRTKTT